MKNTGSIISLHNEQILQTNAGKKIIYVQIRY